MNINLIEKLSQNKILPIIRSRDIDKVTDTAHAIIDSGLDIIEITVENPLIYKAIRELSKEAIICAGGIITSIQTQAAIENGAKIISSPIFQQNLVKISKDRHIPLIAGATTANEAYNAWKARIPLVKIYPAKVLGGADYIKNLLRPMPFLNTIPQGDVALNDVPAYIEAGALAVGIGRDITNCTSYSEITNKIKKILEILK